MTDIVSKVLLGKELERTREKAHLSLEALAATVGRSPGVVEAIEQGLVTATPRYIRRVLGACNRAELWMNTTLPPKNSAGP
jgi:transcriptional regulator with XRE-family HTH domain